MAATPHRKRNEPLDCPVCVFQGLAPCPGSNPIVSNALGAWIDIVELEPDSILFSLGDRAASVHCIRRGVMKLVRYDMGGNQRIVRILTGGDLVALESAFEHEQQHTAIAVTHAQICRIPAPQFRQVAARDPTIQHRLLEQARSALKHADYWLTDLVGNTKLARVRLARLLVRLRIGSTSRLHRLRLADYGGILGIAPETVCRILNDLMEEGVIAKAGSSQDGRLFNADMERLMQIASDTVAA